MLMEAKNQIYSTYLSIKYALQRELLNKITFISIDNLSTFILEFSSSSFLRASFSISNSHSSPYDFSIKIVINSSNIFPLHFSNEHYFFKDRTFKGRTDCPPSVAINVGAMMPYIEYTPRTLKELVVSNIAI